VGDGGPCIRAKINDDPYASLDAFDPRYGRG
jgi:hypothetical protein